MIESRPSPLRGAVAGFAGLWESRRDVIRARRRLELRQMAGHASRRQCRVLVVHMAGRAGYRSVFAGQRELRGGVIEDRSRPLRSRVAERTVLREASGDVIRIRGRLVFCKVAIDAGCSQAREFTSHMATRAGDGGVFACEWELRSGMVKGRGRPSRGCVAGLAGLRESCVARIRSGLIGRQVAICTRGAEASKHIVHVARRAGRRGVFACEREAGRVVVERGPCPQSGGMAGLAGLRQFCCGMVRICRLLEVCQMAGNAGRRQRRVLVVHMAGRACD